MSELQARLEKSIAAVVDYPKPGIVFRDITPVLADGQLFADVIEHLANRYREQGVTKVVGIEARGFIFATALAYALNVGFVPLRKPGKLPRKTESCAYQLEYGEDRLEMHADALSADDKVIIIDDLLATGGTVCAAVELIKQSSAHLIECSFLITLADLAGVKRLESVAVPHYTLCSF